MTEPVAGSRSIAGVSILLVEDDRGDASLVRSCLAEAGIPDGAVTVVRGLDEAVAAVEADPPGCILLDVELPGADGYGGVHKMVEAAPDIAVLVLTGQQERDGIEALTAGAQDYLAKNGLTGELLERSIRYATERKRAQRAQQQLREARVSAAEQARLERGLLPTPLLRSSAVSTSTYYQPGRDDAVLGGDFFDVVETEDGRVRAVIGDVMGHGPDEAALGVHLRVAWRTLVLGGTPDEQILPTLDALLEAEQDVHPRYVTVCDVTIAADGTTARIAGHPAPIVCVEGAPHYPNLEIGPPLGVRLARTGKWPTNDLGVPPGSSLVLYTDGLLDAYTDDSEPESLGITELVAAVQRCVSQTEPARAWIAALVTGANRESIDDTAVVVLTIAPGD